MSMLKKKVGKFKVSYNRARYLNQVLSDREYDFLSYYPVVVDVGANIGTFSLFIYDLADKIYAVEPVEENIDCLRQTIRDNELTKITPVQMAISDKSFIQRMERLGDPGEGGWKLSDIGDYPVDTRTLKDFMRSQEIDYIDLLKIDVEGEEAKIFNTRLFPYKQIGAIVGEYHGGNGGQVKEILEWMGYRFLDCGGGHFIARR